MIYVSKRRSCWAYLYSTLCKPGELSCGLPGKQLLLVLPACVHGMAEGMCIMATARFH